MDNFKIDVTGVGDESLARALEIAFAHNAPSGKATHYCADWLTLDTRYYSNKSAEHLPDNLPEVPGLHVHHCSEYKQDYKGHLTLVLLWSEMKGSCALPYPMRAKDAISLVQGWLDTAGEPGPEPDIDGSLGRAWRVFTGDWGHVGQYTYAIAAIQACYAMYGK